jgi:DNA-directed RNA polymerase subunit RPC12/RpoP
MIEFLCPNGHKIHCPEERAGLPAKCPRCGIRFLIPTLEEASAALGTASETAVSAEAEGAGIKARPVGGSGPSPEPPQEPQIEFFCPQGHHLHGPASLQGKPGECPECGSRFRIPTLEDLAAAGPAEEEIRLEEAKTSRLPMAEGTPAAGAHEPLRREIPTAARAQPSGSDSSVAMDLPPEAILSPPGAHPMAELFARFWAARAEGSRVEVHLASGGVLLPDGYVATMSQLGHAVLVTRDPDGSHTVTLVPWDSVARVILRGIRQVPGEIVR